MIYLCSNKSPLGYINQYFYDVETNKIYYRGNDNSNILIHLGSHIMYKTTNIPDFTEILYHEVSISRHFLDNLIMNKILDSLC